MCKVRLNINSQLIITALKFLSFQTRPRKTMVISSNAISLHNFKLILCMFGCFHNLQYEIRKPIPKGPFTKLFTCSV
jgi:hypothetical protein